MSEPPDDPDPSADTERFEAFVRGGDREPEPRAATNTFRVLTLVGGLVVLAFLAWLLLAA
jgi:hypothetical protein